MSNSGQLCARTTDQQKASDATQQPSSNYLVAGKRGASSRNVSHNYGLEKSALAENRNFSNFVPSQTAKPSFDREPHGLTKKESRCSWNKFTYGAGSQKIDIAPSKLTNAENSYVGHTYGASETKQTEKARISTL